MGYSIILSSITFLIITFLTSSYSIIHSPSTQKLQNIIATAYYRNAYSSVKFPFFAWWRRVPNVEFHDAKKGVAAPRFVVIPKWRIIMYNARAFFAVNVLVHVGAPVREVALHGKRYTLPASPLRTLLAYISILGRLLSASLFPSSRHSSFRPRGPSPSVPGISRLVHTRLIQMNPRIVRCISRKTNWILKIKKRRSRSLHVADLLKPMNPRTDDCFTSL